MINRLSSGFGMRRVQFVEQRTRLNIDDKSLKCCGKKEMLEELFRTLLHQLMTRQIKVNSVEFEDLMKS